MRKRAVIFDMDGVITDSEPCYAEAINIVLAPRGLFMGEEDHRQTMGSSIDDTWAYVMDRFDLDGPAADWKAAYDEAVVDVLSRSVTPAPGLLAVLDGLRERGVKVGLATSSRARWVDTVLERLAVRGYFEAIAACDDVPEAKPHPGLYLLAARRLGVPPEASLAIEDTPRGIQSAMSAGMVTIAVRTESTAHLDISAADVIIDSLEAFDFGWLDGR